MKPILQISNPRPRYPAPVIGLVSSYLMGCFSGPPLPNRNLSSSSTTAGSRPAAAAEPNPGRCGDGARAPRASGGGGAVGAQAPPPAGARGVQGVAGVHPAGALAHPPHRPRRRRPRRGPRRPPARLLRRDRPPARVPEDTDQAVRQRGRLQGRHPQALPRRGAARVAEAAHVAAAEVPARVAGGCFKGSGIYPTYRHCRMSVEPEWRHIRAASCF
ncbi:hypothetical protein PVAP13_6KG378906 [Panicum virgatum]|uniref:Uncharacterized protein n=1 Tax=Panicum virgatum TaxID=38727 RepID=A0A8T0RKU8_PANVG|nr:hypothetical protein PVAP13_6KG378906 [Panicum virgatum]